MPKLFTVYKIAGALKSLGIDFKINVVADKPPSITTYTQGIGNRFVKKHDTCKPERGDYQELNKRLGEIIGLPDVESFKVIGSSCGNEVVTTTVTYATNYDDFKMLDVLKGELK